MVKMVENMDHVCGMAAEVADAVRRKDTDKLAMIQLRVHFATRLVR